MAKVKYFTIVYSDESNAGLCHVTRHVCKQTEALTFESIFFVSSAKQDFIVGCSFSRKVFVYLNVIFSYRVDRFIDCDDELTIEKVDFYFVSQDSNRHLNFRFQEAMNSSSVQIAVELGFDLPLIRRTVEW